MNMLSSMQGLFALVPVYSVTKLSGTYGMNLMQYQANKRTPFPPASTKDSNETFRSKVKVNIFQRK
jgi:hypothetical protein